MLLYKGETLGYILFSLETKSIDKDTFSKMIKDYNKYTIRAI